MKPFLSVLIPCRNEVRSLGRCLASVIASDYPEDRMEVLVVDGASTDGTRDVISHWARSHARIRMLEAELEGRRPDFARLDGAHAPATRRFLRARQRILAVQD